MGENTPSIPLDIQNSLDLFSPNEPLNSGKSAPKRSSNADPEPINNPKRVTNPENPSPSISTIYIHPSLETPFNYSPEDKGPFLVHVSRTESDPSAGSTLRPIKIGLFLTHNNISGIIKGSVKSAGRNRVSIEFITAEHANHFIKNQLLTSNCLIARIPSYNITRLGLVRGVPCEWSMAEFVEAAQLPPGCGVILKARRLNRKITSEGNIQWAPTQSVVVTIAGQVLPNNIYCHYTSLRVETYLLPTIQCHNCCRFGHIKTQCRSKPRCYRCTQNHTGDSCDVDEQSAICIFCSGNHFSTNKNCNEQARQKSIKVVMSQQNISYVEASEKIPLVQKSYSEVVNLPSTPSIRTYDQESNQLSNSQTQFNLPTYSRSYKKTISTPVRPKSILGKGYDRQTHLSLTSPPQFTLPNGSAIQSNALTPNENLVELLLDFVSNFILKFNDCIPNNVADKVAHLANLIRPADGPSQIPAMEL